MMSDDYSASGQYEGHAGSGSTALQETRGVREPPIQYVRTSDGVNIAYYSIGDGAPVLVYVVPFGHVAQDWKLPELRAWSEALAANRRLVRLDRRGTGLSDRDREFTLDSAVQDIEAVVRKEGLKRFALMGQRYAAAIAILYASQHPEKVSHLVLWSPVPGGEESLDASPPQQAAYAAASKDWRTFTELFAQQATGWADADQARRYAAYLREIGYTSEEHRRTLSLQFDVSEYLGRLAMPVLVIHRRESAFPAIEVVRKLAASTAGARLVLLEGSAFVPSFGDSRAVLQAFDSFLAVPNEPRPAGLTERELEILTLLAKGSSNSEIANALSISTRTVDRHIANIYRKIGAHNRAEATAYAYQQGIAAVA